MKTFVKRIFYAFLIICALLGLTLIVKAHGGKTDGNGGHYDRSDGSYHYHHGYSAHDHYDMDGDGYKDCPYDFDDKTDHGSNSSNDTTDFEIEDENSVTFLDVLVAMLSQFLPAVGIGISGAYILSYIWLWIFGEEKGCLITWISSVILFIASYIWLIFKFI